MEEIKNRPLKVLVNSSELIVAPFEIPDRGPDEAAGPDSINTIEFLIRVESEIGGEIADEDLPVKLIDDLDLLAEYVRQRTAPADNSSG